MKPYYVINKETQLWKRRCKIRERELQRKNLALRLDLDGPREYIKANTIHSKIFWMIVSISAYIAAVYFSYLTSERYGVGKTIVSRKQKPPGTFVVFPPDITLCHTAHWNRTYFEQYIEITDEILTKAERMGIRGGRSRLLDDFSRYVDYYYLTEVQEIEGDLWNLLGEVFQHNFETNQIQFSDFVSDASLRPLMLKKCWYRGQRYACSGYKINIDSPSCFMIPIKTDTGYQTNVASNDTDRASLKIQIEVPRRDLFEFDDLDSSYGVKLHFGPNPSSLKPQWVFPENTHALVAFHWRRQALLPPCLTDGGAMDSTFMWWNTYDTCLAGVLENYTMSMCGCYFMVGAYYPRNGVVCTPKMIKECVQEKASDFDFEDDSGVNSFMSQKRKCLRRCHSEKIEASFTFYNLENVDRDTMKNLITIRPDWEQGYEEQEQYLISSYNLFSKIGGVVSVYTGLSVAAFIRAAAILGKAGLISFNKKILKRALALVMMRTPVSVRWDMPMTMRHYRTMTVPKDFSVRLDV